VGVNLFVKSIPVSAEVSTWKKTGDLVLLQLQLNKTKMSSHFIQAVERFVK
jgi:hypothetical protein